MLKQLEVLEKQFDRNHRLALLKLWVEDAVRSGGGLEGVSVRLDEALCGVRMYTPKRLSWCQRVGIDRFGVFADVGVEAASFKMRWIPAGSFLMGSPEGEDGREKHEGPQHEVRLTNGFWLCDVPCVQALWEAVMGENPSEFKSADRPVENVSWEDCQSFLRRLNERESGLGACLPTEAQWEYACRAGTKTSTYAGVPEVLGKNNAPVLDSIAWYAGNSGVEFDLKDGEDSSGWVEKQFEHSLAGTHIVAQKAQNDFGLCDMLGNVWEWCADGMRRFAERRETDPVGPHDMSRGAKRIIRGGAWNFGVRFVRAACRSDLHRKSRDNDLGFRICLMPGSSSA